MAVRIALGALALIAFAGCSPTARTPLEGTWRVTEIHRIGKNGQSADASPQPGIVVFTARHYSMLWTPAGRPRLMFATRWQPTPEEKLASFDGLEASSGTWESSGDVLTLHPIVSKVPDAMGGRLRCEYVLAGDSLWITVTEATARDGQRDARACSCVTPLKLVRIE